MVIWLTGLSSSGKSTLSEYVGMRLREMGHTVVILDGDAIRRHLWKDLGFRKQDRNENIRRIGWIAELLSQNGILTIVAAISPYRAMRDTIRRRIPNFIEVYVNAPLQVCEARDVKGLYRRARIGEIHGLAGLDDPYECPTCPDVECLTNNESVEASGAKILDCVLFRLHSGS